MKTLCTFLTCFLFFNLTAQNWKTFTYHKKVYDIEKEGNTLWIATSGGLIVWNLQTEAYYKLTTEDGLISNQINEIAIDADGKKWLATSRGVSMIDGGTITSYNSDNGLESNDVKSVVIDSQGNKWFATKKRSGLGSSSLGNSAVSKVDNQGNWSTIPESLYFGPTCMTIDSADNLYIGTYKQIAKYTPSGEWSIFLSPSPESIGWISEMEIDENQELWAISGDGLYHYDSAGNQTLFDAAFGLVSYPTSLFIDSNQTKWIGTEQGYSKVNADSTFSNFNIGQHVLTIFEDDVNILLGTLDDVTSYDGNNYEKLTTGIDLGSNTVRGLDISNDGSVWMGTGSGISKYDSNGEWTRITKDDGLVCNPAYSLLATSQDELIISHQTNCNGVSFIDIPTGDASFLQNDTFPFLLSLNEDLNGNVWLGYHVTPVFGSHYATRISPNGDIKFYDFTTVLPNTSNNKTTGIAIHPNGDIYFSTRMGIYRINTNDEIELFQSAVAAATIFIDSQENIWIAEGDFFGSSHSLQKYTPTGDHIIYQNNEMYGFKIYEIIEDDQQNIWIASENGLFKLNPDEVFTRYSTLDGLADDEVTGIEFDADGGMWISTRNGVSTTAALSTATSNVENITIQLQLFPNPILTTATLNFDLEKNGNVQVEIYNVAGQLLRSVFDGKKSTGNHQLEFDVSEFSQGIYFCKVKIGEERQVLKFVKM